MVASIARQLLDLVELTAPRHAEGSVASIAQSVRTKSRYGIAFEASFRDPSDQPSMARGHGVDGGVSDPNAIKRSASRRMSRRSTRVLGTELTRQGTSQNFALQVEGTSSSGVWSRDVSLCKLGKGRVVTDQEGLLLNSDLEPCLHGKNKVPARHMLMIEVQPSKESPMNIEVTAFNATVGEEYRATVKMPSLALVDPSAAYQWARELANRACVKVLKSGTRELRFDSPLTE